jgi:hypothetical protein
LREQRLEHLRHLEDLVAAESLAGEVFVIRNGEQPPELVDGAEVALLDDEVRKVVAGLDIRGLQRWRFADERPDVPVSFAEAVIRPARMSDRIR